MLRVSWAWSFSRSLSQPQLPERLGRWADGVLPGEAWGDSRYWGLLHSTLKPTSPGPRWACLLQAVSSGP